jgi:uncharacterized protein YyaL (SSP411 family)
MTRRPANLIASLLLVSPLAIGEQGKPRNHLANEKSPYLQQHASNPVDWYPWGEEAFAKARKENKPIFLSVGYSTCHWCHVMARESFSNPEIAKVMNEHFINIKVDREERPDVDGVYMTFVEATTGSGGWPMSVWMTPDLKPFVGGTYYPPADSEGRPGFKSVLGQIATTWKDHESAIRKSAGEVVEQLRSIAGKSETRGDLPAADLLETAFEKISSSFDFNEGGFGSAPKFPRPVALDFLHQYAALQGTKSAETTKALEITSLTLRKMADGGIHDHLSGGFHRYSVDRFWHIPHYEKMLYDQAQLTISYLDAAKLHKEPSFQRTARDILAYVTRRMTSPEGGFYSAEDADSMKTTDADHKTEGAFYIWEKKEIDRLLGENAALFNSVYGVEAKGNAPEGSDPHGDLTGTNTLIRRLTDTAAAEQFKLTTGEVTKRLATARKRLFEARDKRPHPHLDDKILTGWNGLMISAFARAYQDLGDKEYLDAASRAATFLQTRLYDKKRGVLLRSYRDGPADIDGFATDYAFLIRGLTDLYQAGFDTRWLAWADKLQSKQDELFLDRKSGGYFASAEGDPHILIRAKESYDGAEPSDNSISALNLQRLDAMLDQPDRTQQARNVIRSFAGQLEKSPTSSPAMLVALATATSKATQIIIAGQPDASDTKVMFSIVRARFNPSQVVLLADGAEGQKFLASHAEFYQTISAIDGKATAFVCENFVCNLPTNDPEKLRKLLEPK